MQVCTDATQGVLIIDDTTSDKSYAKHMLLTTVTPKCERKRKMMQDISRLKNLPLGTAIGLYGDYNAPSTWEEILGVKVFMYIKVDWIEGTVGRCMDMGILALRQETINIEGFKKIYSGRTFLLLHRYYKAHWDHSDPSVHVYGIPDDAKADLFLNYDGWHERAVWLSAGATMCVVEKENMSQMAKLILKEYKII